MSNISEKKIFQEPFYQIREDTLLHHVVTCHETVNRWIHNYLRWEEVTVIDDSHWVDVSTGGLAMV